MMPKVRKGTMDNRGRKRNRRARDHNQDLRAGGAWAPKNMDTNHGGINRNERVGRKIAYGESADRRRPNNKILVNQSKRFNTDRIFRRFVTRSRSAQKSIVLETINNWSSDER
jgi:hypothetical protein